MVGVGGVGVGVIVGVWVGVGVSVGGIWMRSFWPISTRLGSFRWLRSMMSSTVTPYIPAMIPRVSPVLTVWVITPENWIWVGVGVSVMVGDGCARSGVAVSPPGGVHARVG